jgi:hypothetical protein
MSEVAIFISQMNPRMDPAATTQTRRTCSQSRGSFCIPVSLSGKERFLWTRYVPLGMSGKHKRTMKIVVLNRSVSVSAS